MADTIALRHRNEITDRFAMEFQKSKSPKFASRKSAANVYATNVPQNLRQILFCDVKTVLSQSQSFYATDPRGNMLEELWDRR